MEVTVAVAEVVVEMVAAAEILEKGLHLSLSFWILKPELSKRKRLR